MRRRHAFTLVELLVAMALIILIMSVLSQAFITATSTLRDLKALGDMAERLRGVKGMLVRDLAADHFTARTRLSDPTFWANGPPPEGFFRIWQGSPGIDEGPDPANLDPRSKLLHSFRSTDHMLHFTVKLRGNLRSDFMSASVPLIFQSGVPQPLLIAPTLGNPDRRYQDSGSYNAQWAEVGYFLRPVPDQTGNPETAGGTPLFALYRRQRLAVPDNSLVQDPNNPAYTLAEVYERVPNPAAPNTFVYFNRYLEMSTTPVVPPPASAPTTPVRFNSPLDLTMPGRRFGALPSSPPNLNYAGLLTGGTTYPLMGEENGRYQAADLILTDVLSFDVRVLLFGGTDFVDLFDPSVQIFNNNTNPNPRFYNAVNAAARQLPAVFDTWSSVTDDTYNYGFDPALNPTATPPGTVAWTFPGTDRTIPLYQNRDGQTIRITAIQITIRVWDFKTKQARQITIGQDL
jgi:hypothetical protein